MTGKVDNVNAIGAFLGFFGAANCAAIGFYLLSTILSTSRIVSQPSDGWIAGVAFAIPTIILFYGSFLVLSGNAKKGGKINVAGGLILACLYIYYSAFSEPNLLSWLNPAGIAMVIPPILSGAIGVLKGARANP